MQIAAAHLAAIALGVFGLGLVVAAFIGSTFGEVRLFIGIGLLVVAMVTSGLQLLATGGATRDEEEGT